MNITREYLRSHPKEIFVYGDNLKRRGNKGAAELRDEPNTYGFITKKYPSGCDDAFYKPGEYRQIFDMELCRLRMVIMGNPDTTYLISKLGAGLANRFGIFETVIEPKIKTELECLPNVKFLW